MGDNRDGERKDIRTPGQLQQSRRFACDRCRMQKLRCERDIWSSPLMSCKRCRKRNLTCTISPRTDRTSIRRSRRRSSSKIVTKVPADDPEHSTDDTSSSSGKIIDQWPNTPLPDFENGFWRNTEHALPSIPINHLHPACGYLPGRSVDSFGPTVLSGLITPPSDAGREIESRYQSSIPLLSNSQGNRNASYVRQRLERDYISYHENADDIHLENPLENEEQLDTSGNLDHDPMERLLDLHSFLVRESKRITCRDMDEFQYTQSAVQATDGMQEDPMSLDAAIQTAYWSSEQFLDILRDCNMSGLPDSPSISLLASDVAGGNNFPLIEGSGHDLSMQLSPLQTAFVGYGSIQGADALGFASPAEQHQQQFLGEQYDEPDIPTTLTLVSCYISLVQFYHAIFSRILQSMITCVSAGGHLTPGAAGLSLSDYAVNNMNFKSQLRIVIHDSMHFLAVIEDYLSFSERQCLEERGLNSSFSTVLFDSLSRYEDATFGNGPENTKKALEETFDAINQLLEMAS